MTLKKKIKALPQGEIKEILEMIVAQMEMAKSSQLTPWERNKISKIGKDEA